MGGSALLCLQDQITGVMIPTVVTTTGAAITIIIVTRDESGVWSRESGVRGGVEMWRVVGAVWFGGVVGSKKKAISTK